MGDEVPLRLWNERCFAPYLKKSARSPIRKELDGEYAKLKRCPR
jgi:hypothetical protein